MSLLPTAAPPPTPARARRPAVILLVVVILLALFAVVGLSFMFYAEAEATSSRIFRESQVILNANPDVPPKELLDYAMGQWLFDVKDSVPDVYSAMRGQSLGRNTYGWNYTLDASGNYVAAQNNNTIPFNGLGALKTNPRGLGMVDWDVVNYTYYARDGALMDPERYGARPNPNTAIAGYMYVGGFNAPYTFPDRNNLYLAAIQADYNGTGIPRVLMPSFVRPNPKFRSTGSPPGIAGSLDPTNPAWLDTTDPKLKYYVLRPRPADHYYNPADPNRSFPLPGPGGDVQNVPGINGYISNPNTYASPPAGLNDSYWMDLNYPVQTDRSGRRYKPLFAFLIVDLDNRVNVNVHGNVKGQTNTHASNQGLGGHEVNLHKILDPTGSDPLIANQYRTLLMGNPPPPSPNWTVAGRYNGTSVPNERQPGDGSAYNDGYPFAVNGVAQEVIRSALAKLDFDAVDENTTQVTAKFQMPSGNFAAFPTFGAGYDNLSPPSTAAQNNPLSYNVMRAQPADRVPFKPDDNMYYLLAGATASQYTRSALNQFIPNAIDSAKVRQLITTTSFDLDVPAPMPWVVGVTDQNNGYVLRANELFPTGGGVPTGSTSPAAMPLPPADQLGTLPGVTDFLPNDGRTNLRGRLDLRRRLMPYIDPNTKQFRPPTGPEPNRKTTPRPYGANQQYWQALHERQDLAEEIFQRAVLATGANTTAPPGGPADFYNARRYLAQLAVNIVDYIDEDDISTPFNWNENESTAKERNNWVFGVELPRLVINETYCEMRNDQPDPGFTDPMQLGATKPAKFNFFLELFNPLPPTGVSDPNLANQDRHAAQLQKAGNPASIYRIRIVDEAIVPPSTYRQPDNFGDVPAAQAPTAIKGQVFNFETGFTNAANSDIKIVLPNTGNQQVAPGQNQGFYVIASQEDFEGGDGSFQPTNRVPEGLSYSEMLVGTTAPQKSHTILLQRLACPHLPPNPRSLSTPPFEESVDANLPYNPYITIDYMMNVRAQDNLKALAAQGGTQNMVRPVPPQLSDLPSVIRSQPYAAALVGGSQGNAPAGQPKSSFFSHNAAAGTFDWLVHLDRQPISMAEMLHVCGFRPHELTQLFIGASNTPPPPPGPVDSRPPPPPGAKFRHTSPWTTVFRCWTTDEVNNARLFRVLEYLTVSERTFGAFGGRQAGLININTVWDKETLQALTDPQANSNHFTQLDVDRVWNTLRGRRSRSFVPANPAATPDQPIWGAAGPVAGTGTAADGQYPTALQAGETQGSYFPGDTANGVPAGVGVQNTLYGHLFQGMPPPDPSMQINPYLAGELFTKVRNNVTTRSNVFAVFLTVGFFEVMDDSTLPVKLGAEIKNRNGTHTRHRMFAIVDRTQFALDYPVNAADTNARLRHARIRPVVMASQTSIPAGATTARISVAAPGGMLSTYDGKAIETYSYTPGGGTLTGIVPNSLLYLDVGLLRQQGTPADQGMLRLRAQVMAVTADAANNQVHIDVAPQFAPVVQYPAGFLVSNVELGNPGPQGKIDVNDTRFKSLIPYWLIIQ